MRSPEFISIPNGAWPVMLTPFSDDRSIDFEQVDELTDWLIDQGAAGIFTVALSSEMYDLTPEERLELARRVVDRAAGRVPVLASSVATGDVADQSASVRAMAATGVTAVVLISSLIAGPGESEETWLANVQHIIEESPTTNFGIYECPLPYKRLPTLESVTWLAESGRFVFFKDTSHSVQVMRERLAVIEGTGLKLFNAEMSSLTASLKLGASGFCGYAANVYPELVSWLCEHWDDGDPDSVITEQRILTTAEFMINARYPTSAKYFLAHSSRVPIRPISRWKPESISSHDGDPLVAFADYVADLRLPGIPRVANVR